MAKSMVSPGVFTNEVDASFLGPGVGAIGGAIIGTAPKGPAHVPVTVTNFSEFVSYFGNLNEDTTLGYAARSYLKNAGVANIVRVLGPSGRTVNGAAVTPGYTSDVMWTISAVSGTVGVVAALIEITASAGMRVRDSASFASTFVLSGTGVGQSLLNWGGGLTCSFNSASSDYIEKVLNTDPTLFSTRGHHLLAVYNYALKPIPGLSAVYSSSSFTLSNFAVGFASASSPWIKSQPFAGAENNLFRIHTLGHGAAENGRFKISIKNIKVSAAPTVDPYGKFDLEVRDFVDTDKSPSVVESFPNLSLDPASNYYIGRMIGDKYWTYDATEDKMRENGVYENRSKFIRVEITTGVFDSTSLPWGFRGLAKPQIMAISGTALAVTGAIRDLPYVGNLMDKESQAEAKTTYYWGMETQLSGAVKARLTMLPTMTGSDADFSLKNITGSTLSTLGYDAATTSGTMKAPGDTTSHTSLEPTLAKFTVPVAFGFDGWDIHKADPLDNGTELLTVSQLGTQALRQAVDIIKDPDFIDINLLAIPGVHSPRVVDYAIDKVTDRGDVFYVADVTGSTPSAVVTEVRARGLDTNYASFYYPSVKVWDDVNSLVKTVPASVAAIGAIAYNDRVAYPWFAPAGLNRAGLGKDVMGFDVRGLSDNLKQSERDTLYENRINPIARFPDVPQGVIWGQKTLQLKASALDRINVRRLMIKAKKLVASAVKFLVFEPNNAATRTKFKQMVNPILADIQQKQGLDVFKVVMDESTTTPDLIDRNTMYGKIYLVPTRTAEFIAIDFIISPAGTTFAE